MWTEPLGLPAGSVLRIASVLVSMHAGSLGAVPSQANPPLGTDIQATIAAGQKLRQAGDFYGALKAFDAAAKKASEAGDVRNQARALMLKGGCQLLTFQYRRALSTLDRAGDLARRAKDDTTAGAVAITLSALYSQLGDTSTARAKADEAVRLLAHSGRRDYVAKARANLALVQSEAGDSSAAENSFSDAIAAAQKARMSDLESAITDEFGISLVLAAQKAERAATSPKELEAAWHLAEKARTELNQAHNLETQTHNNDQLAGTCEHLAELELTEAEIALKQKEHNYRAASQAHYHVASDWIEKAFSTPSLTFKTSPQYYPIHVRAQIIQGLQGDWAALPEFRKAVDSATEWRESALPGDITSSRTVAYLHQVYADYAEVAAGLALVNRDSTLAADALRTLAENRAASLREQLTLALTRSGRLPQAYFELISKLQSAQARVTLGEKRGEDEEQLRSIRAQLAELENKVGLHAGNFPQLEEKPSHKKSLKDIQSKLGLSEALLSFSLGENKSFLWAVTGDRVDLYQLPSQSEIRQCAAAFSRAVQNGGRPSTGQPVTHALFGQLSPAIWQKRDWLIVADGALLNGFPFAGLPQPNSLQPLITTHTLRLLPSELLLIALRPKPPEQRFLGMGDPIYNLVDARRRTPIARIGRRDDGSQTPLGRLAGSASEIRNAAAVSGMPETELLIGADATSEKLREALRTPPEIIHFAVHVVSPNGRPEEAALALSLTDADIPEILTSEAIAEYRVPGSLVVLSGCFSEQGQTLPGAGVMGLSRAWLLAGASAVIVSAWPTPDDSGHFFSAFYGHLQTLKKTTLNNGSIAKRASVALQQAQLDMQRSRGYRSLPGFWAAYSMISKE